MDKPPPASAGILDSFRALGAGLIGTIQTRLALFATELHEEKFRLIQTFVWISAAVFTGMMAITFASLTFVYFLWESSRLAALAGLTAFYVGSLAVILLAFRRFLARQPKPFGATIEELREDRACIHKRS